LLRYQRRQAQLRCGGPRTPGIDTALHIGGLLVGSTGAGVRGIAAKDLHHYRSRGLL
jgi:hypothetical protein